MRSIVGHQGPYAPEATAGLRSAPGLGIDTLLTCVARIAVRIVGGGEGLRTLAGRCSSGGAPRPSRHPRKRKPPVTEGRLFFTRGRGGEPAGRARLAARFAGRGR